MNWKHLEQQQKAKTYSWAQVEEGTWLVLLFIVKH